MERQKIFSEVQRHLSRDITYLERQKFLEKMKFGDETQRLLAELLTEHSLQPRAKAVDAAIDFLASRTSIPASALKRTMNRQHLCECLDKVLLDECGSPRKKAAQKLIETYVIEVAHALYG